MRATIPRLGGYPGWDKFPALMKVRFNSISNLTKNKMTQPGPTTEVFKKVNHLILKIVYSGADVKTALKEHFES